MDNHDSRRKWAPKTFQLDPHCTDNGNSLLAEEQHILELILLGAALPVILDKLCTMIDIGIGNVVSLVWLPDEKESQLGSIAQSAVQFGLSVFSSTSILSRDESLLGTLQVYSCDQRRPTPHEIQMIERAILLAAVALQQHKDSEDFESTFGHLKGAIGGSGPEKPRFIN